nr:hypothetical protein [Tanacetum cinerariifolium]
MGLPQCMVVGGVIRVRMVLFGSGRSGRRWAEVGLQVLAGAWEGDKQCQGFKHAKFNRYQLLLEVYALVSTHKVAKELWERIQMLMQGTSLTKHERECKLYDEFDKFAYRKGETLRDFYLSFSLLLNDMNMYNMKLEQFQFVSQGPSSNLSISYPVNDIPLTVNHNAYMASSSAHQIDYALIVHHPSEFSSPETGLVVLVFQKGDDPIDVINHMMSFLTAVVTS